MDKIIHPNAVASHGLHFLVVFAEICAPENMFNMDNLRETHVAVPAST
jgi:hypothetical protein